MAKYTKSQGQYLAFIYYFTKLNGVPPAETDMQRHFRVSAPSVHQMVVTLTAKGLISRVPGQPRTRVQLPAEEIPPLA
ncbi:MAG: MarR family transcriptional regulator [Acidobacteria bacterium]|nr:MAG: MarR family transcriptional regulator [Acidobacteriota bacterium]